MRYYTADVTQPEFQGCLLVSGPQDESQILEEVKVLLKKDGIKKVVVFYDHGQGLKATSFQPMTEGS